MEQTSPPEPLNRPLRLLSLDGGGIRGISELVILQEIMHRVGRALEVETPLPADYFDMICGTSTGGLIAILLGRLRLSVPEAIDAYLALAKQVFSEKKAPGKDGAFKASNLEKAIKETIESKLGKGHADDKMFMTDTISCKTFVCAVPAMHVNNQPRLFRTWSADENPGYNCTIWEAARATSAAPTFFKRIYIGDAGIEEEFIDAGMGCNNPVRYLIEEAIHEFGPDRKVDCIISIGTGKSMAAGFKAPGIFRRAVPLDLIKVMKAMTTDSEAEALRMKDRLQNCHGLYHRLNVEQGLELVSLQEWEKLGEVKAHTEAYLRDETIKQEIGVIVDALIGKSLDAFPLGQLDGAVTAHSYYLYPSHQVTQYVARNDFVDTIQNHFRIRQNKSAPTIAVLYGMGGCGKTQVALEYCRQGQSRRWFSAIFWFDASTPASMAQSFADAAHKLSRPDFDVADVNGNIRFVLNAIETRNIHWLLVFDNFDDPSAFGDENIMDYFPRGAHASILFTTRHAGVKDMGLGIDVTFMLDKEALDLLLNRSHVERSDANMQEGANIVKRLGYHALAIDQAGAYIKAGGLDICLYMEHYTKRQEKVLSEIPELWDYQRRLKTDSEAMTKLTVFTTWELSVQLITGTPTERKDKIHILTLAAFLDSNEVSDDLFACYGSENIDWLVSCVTDGVWDKYEAQDVLKELRKLSLLQSLNIRENGATFSLHPLIHDWVKLRVINDHRVYATEAILLLSTFLQNHPIDEMTLSIKQALLSHLEVVFQNENKYKVLQGDLEGIKLHDATLYFGEFFDSQGRYNSSEQMIRQALKWTKRVLGKEHPDTLLSMNNLGIALQKQGKNDEAEQIHRQTLLLRERVLGKEHPDTIGSMNRLGVVLQEQGKYDEAELMYRQTLLLQEMVLSKEHPDTLESMNNLGVVLGRWGKLNEAEKIHQQTLLLREKVLGKEHPDTLESMNNLGVVLECWGKLNEAEKIHRQTLQLREKVLGKEHPDTLRSMENLVSIYRDLGREAEAHELELMIYSIRADGFLEFKQPLVIPRLDDDSEAESDISGLTDVPSIFSTADSLAPSDSTNDSKHASYTNAAEQLAAELLKEDELKSLYEAAWTKLGKARFAKTHDILLKELLIALRIGATGHQLQAVRVLRSKDPRTRVTTRIMGLLEPSNLAREQVMRDFQTMEADRQYSLNQLLTPLVQVPVSAGSATEENAMKFKAGDIMNRGGTLDGYSGQSDEFKAGDIRNRGGTLDGYSEQSDESEDESEDNSDEELENPLEALHAVVAFLIKGAPFTQFKTRLWNLIHPPTTLQEALNTRHRSTIQKFLRNQFHFIAKDNYAWLYELHEAGYSCREMAELLLEEADYAPWIPFHPSLAEYADIQQGTHIPRCVHQVNANDFESPQHNLNIPTEDLLRKNEAAKRTVEELCGLAGVSPMSWDFEDWNGNVEFDQNNTQADVCYTRHVHEESDFRIGVSRTMKALNGFCEAFGYIQQAGLCCDSFTVIVSVAPTPSTSSASSPSQGMLITPQVELWRVDLSLALHLREKFKYLSTLETITHVEITNYRNIAQTILEPVLRNTGYQSVSSSDNIDYTLHLCALAVQFLCLGLLSYCQAHVGAIHPFFLDTPQNSVLLSGSADEHVKIIATLKRLTCFGDMLKGRPVMTFCCVIQPRLLVLEQDALKYDLVASPEDILDTWGPGKFVYRRERQEQPCAISIGGGVIYATDDNAKTFHWELSDPINSREWSIDRHENGRVEFIKAPYTVTFAPHIKIVVGTLVTINETCSLDEEKCWSNCYHVMQPLGTSGTYWKAVERQGGVQAGYQYVFAQLNQTWAKDDGKTLKQMFLDHDDAYLVSFLECRWGLQVSFCTGVAKRVLLRQLVADVIPLFARRAISTALVKEDIWEDLVTTDIIEKFQNQKLVEWYPSLTPNHRKVVSELVCCILRTLKETGLDRDGNLVIAWPQKHDVYQCFKVPCEKQSYWAKILADSKDSATFAYVSTKCLVSSQVLCNGPTLTWRNMSSMLGTAVLPPMSVSRPTEWVLHHGERYFIRTRDSLVHLRVHMNSDNGSASTYACLITKPMNVPEQIKNRLLNRRWQKEEGRLRERRDDFQHSIDVLVLNQEGFAPTETMALPS